MSKITLKQSFDKPIQQNVEKVILQTNCLTITLVYSEQRSEIRGEFCRFLFVTIKILFNNIYPPENLSFPSHLTLFFFNKMADFFFKTKGFVS